MRWEKISPVYESTSMEENRQFQTMYGSYASFPTHSIFCYTCAGGLSNFMLKTCHVYHF